MTAVVETIPCLVITDTEDVHRTNIQVRADHVEAEPDVGFNETYEVMSARLVVDEKMRATIQNRCWIKVEGGAPVQVMNLDADRGVPAEDGVLVLADEELDEQIEEWLIAQSVGYDRDGDAEIAA